MKRSTLRVALAALILAAATSAPAHAGPVMSSTGLLGDRITIKSESGFSGDPTFVDVDVTDGIEVPYVSGGLTLMSLVSIDVADAAIEIDVISTFSVYGCCLQGFRFSGLDVPGYRISGFAVDTTLPSFGSARGISIGDNSLDVDFSPASYSSAGFLKINLQFSPVAESGSPGSVPEPSSIALVGLACVLGLASRRSTRRGPVSRERV